MRTELQYSNEKRVLDTKERARGTDDGRTDRVSWKCKYSGNFIRLRKCFLKKGEIGREKDHFFSLVYTITVGHEHITHLLNTCRVLTTCYFFFHMYIAGGSNLLLQYSAINILVMIAERIS